jgi:hypothetical protein
MRIKMKKILSIPQGRRRVPQTKVFQKWSKWWYWDKHGKLVGPFNTPHEAATACNLYCRRIKIDEVTKRLFKQLHSHTSKKRARAFKRR